MENKNKLTIIQMNDTHGYLEEHFEYLWDGNKEKYIKAGGYPSISSYIQSVREEKNGNVLFLDGGDTLHGTYPLVHSKGEIAVDFLNDLK